jgi:hypothetical protein
MKIRERILARDGGLCRCEECVASGQPKQAGEVDHITPLHKGGSNDDSNLRSLNFECHERKTLQERDGHKYPAPAAADTPLDFLLGVMNDPEQDPKMRLRAAVAAVQYTHNKRGVGGKKEERQEAADKVSGRFAPPASPKLVVNNS